MRTGIRDIAILLGISLLSACAGGEPESVSRQAGVRSSESSPNAPRAVDPTVPVILAFGDSLTNGHDVDRAMTYPSQLQVRLDSLGYGYQVVNQGFDGETTSGGVARLSDALELEPEIVVLEFGGNDGLRGTPIEVAKENLATMIEAFKQIESTVVLAGLTLPRNYGPDYIRAFEEMYVDLAVEYQIALIPFFLDGLVDLETLDTPGASLADAVRHMQSDGTHPTAEGYTIVADTVFKAIQPYLSK
jgi:acyl-CoA thioesterase-1